MPAWTSEKTIDMRFARPVLFVLCLLPVVVLISSIAAGELGANPLEAIRDSTGIWTLRFLLMTLTITPLRRLTKWHSIIKIRRMLGLFAFFYAMIHFVSYVWLDQFFDFSEMVKDLTKRPFIMAGYASFVVLIPLAVTSTPKWIARLGGERWQLLHRLIYVSAAAGVLHYIWRVKLDVSRPVIYGVVLGILIILRMYYLFDSRNRLMRWRISSRTRRNICNCPSVGASAGSSKPQ
jgi:methionine sulfoxide reductase heme-binding subunit